MKKILISFNALVFLFLNINFCSAQNAAPGTNNVRSSADFLFYQNLKTLAILAVVLAVVVVLVVWLIKRKKKKII